MFLELSETFWLWKFLARLHPLLVHFPVGLLCIALLLEIIDWKNKNNKLKPAIHILVIVGSVSAVLAVTFGLMLAKQEEYGGEGLEIHRWSGIATMTISLMALYFLNKNKVYLFRSLLFLSAVGVSVAGHYGAMITHGEDYLTSVLPYNQDQSVAELEGETSPFQFVNDGTELSPEQVQDLNLEVRSILAHNCQNCHGEAKQKGELRLDSKERIFEGGENGVILVANHPEKSEIIRRISLPKSDKEAMPSKGKRLTDREVDVLKYWISRGAPWPDGKMKSIYRVAEMAPRLPEVPKPTKDLVKPIDLFVNNYFSENKIEWKKVVDDQTYIRRVYLDIIGLLPSPDKISNFVNDGRIDKREILAKELLNRNNDYAQNWITFWNDALRNDYSGTGYITGGRFDITNWLYTSLDQNKPYNEFVHQLVSPNKESEGFIKGIKWRGTINASQRTEMQAAQNVAQVLLGLNLKCASCHDSFVSDWKLEDSYAFANIFADTLLEINRCDKPTGKMATTRILYPELGEISIDATTEQRLRQLADNLTKPEDGRLYRTIVNRIWAQLMGRGIVEPVDVMDNMPWSQDLLDYMAYKFTENGYDLKKLIFDIVTSKTYQLPSTSTKEPGDLLAKTYKFEGMVRKRLSAEQFADAISKSFTPMYADSALVTKLLPENFRQQLPFVRAAFVKNDPFLTSLGRPNRETVSTSRTSQANLLQALELTNGLKFNETIKRGAKEWQTKYPSSDTLVTKLYWSALGRAPAAKELSTAQKILGPKPSVESIQDLVWAIALIPEFQLIY